MSHTGRVTVLGYGSVVIFQANETLDSKKEKKIYENVKVSLLQTRNIKFILLLDVHEINDKQITFGNYSYILQKL